MSNICVTAERLAFIFLTVFFARSIYSAISWSRLSLMSSDAARAKSALPASMQRSCDSSFSLYACGAICAIVPTFLGSNIVIAFVSMSF